MGSQVRIASIAVSHGNLKVQIQQSGGLGGDLADSRELTDETQQEYSQTTVLGGTPNVQDLVDALNAVGATPRDIIAILQAVKAAGALFGDLIII